MWTPTTRRQHSRTELRYGSDLTIGLPKIVLPDTGFASGAAAEELQTRGIDPLVAIGRTQPDRPYDFRPPLESRPA